MLWFKAWLEMRWRLLLLACVVVFVETMVITKAGATPLTSGALNQQMEFIWLVVGLSLAGSGVRTEWAFRPTKGSAGSMYYTLSMPVSRARLLISRMVAGLGITAAVMVLGCIYPGLAFESVRRQITMGAGLEQFVAIFGCGLAGYGIATVFSTFLDQQWQAFATLTVVFGSKGMLTLPASIDFLGGPGHLSPVVTGSLPLPAIALSASIFVACAIASAAIERKREY